MKTRSRDVTPMQRTAFSAPNCRRSSKDISSTSWLEAKLLIFPDIDVLLNRTVIDDNAHGMRNELHIWLKWLHRLIQSSRLLLARDQKIPLSSRNTRGMK